ncbi:COG1470 family protein [Methanococcoides sp.]|jgi:glycerol uptake facilitator-like aquaporin|uniref:COG1470 family protein n=1 Tax=Methanococcoides sp. TaxID=1966350 RepID=UPI00272E7DEB|nr:hypothetical protein [Methanococcoides sp.]
MLKKVMIGILVLLMLAQVSSATGVGVSPGRLNFTVQVGSSDIQSLFVKNTGESSSNYLVYVDDAYTEWFLISNDNFILEAGEVKEVFLELKPPVSGTGEHNFKAYVLSTSPEGDLGVGSGIKIPINAKVSNIFIKEAFLSLILIAGSVTYVLYRRRSNVNK